MAMYDATQELENFEAWAKKHGDIDLQKSYYNPHGCLLTECSTLNYVTYHKRETELAWRAYANKK